MLTFTALVAMIEQGDGETSIACRRSTLLEMTRLAAQSRNHTPPSKARLKMLRDHLAALEGDDELEVTGDTFLEVALFASEAL